MFSEMIMMTWLLPNTISLCTGSSPTWHGKKRNFLLLWMLPIKLDPNGEHRSQSPVLSSQMALPWTAWPLWLSLAAHRGGQWWDLLQGTMLATSVPRPIIKNVFVKRELPADIFPQHMATFVIFGILQRKWPEKIKGIMLLPLSRLITIT